MPGLALRPLRAFLRPRSHARTTPECTTHACGTPLITQALWDARGTALPGKLTHAPVPRRSPMAQACAGEMAASGSGENHAAPPRDHRASTRMAYRRQSHTLAPRFDREALPLSVTRRQCELLHAKRAGVPVGRSNYSFRYSHVGTASNQQQQPTRCRLACPSTFPPWIPWRHHRLASLRLGRDSILQNVFFIIGLLVALGGADAQGFWKTARPPDLHASLGSVSVVGAGLMPGAADYVCSFRTTIVNSVLGEFETRTSPLNVTSSTDAVCPVPPWNDLPATTVAFEIYKANALLEKQVSSFRGVLWSPGVASIHPASSAHCVYCRDLPSNSEYCRLFRG